MHIRRNITETATVNAVADIFSICGRNGLLRTGNLSVRKLLFFFIHDGKKMISSKSWIMKNTGNKVINTVKLFMFQYRFG
ncbi:MAG TPA: hypothetical protein PLJ84_03640 [Bacteroidales bacterium]|nr:hypothetical protein [Bacteroidales bacterium]